MNVNPEEVLSALHRARGKGLSLKQLAGQLHLGHSHHQAVRRGLSQLLKEGRARFDGHVYREVASRPAPKEEHRPATPRRAPAAMVEGARARREQIRGGNGAAAPRKAGSEVTGVIHVKPEGYGFVSPLLGEGGRDNDLFVPPQFIKGALDGDVVLARAMKGRDGRLAGEVLDVIERRRQLALGIYQAKGKAQWVIPHDRNLSENIAVPRHPKARDGEMVKVRLHRDRAWVMIAVGSAHRVPRGMSGGPLDREALRRATSVYFPGTVLPMLPERLSNGICSLNPDVDRLCMVCDLALDKNARPLHADIYEAVMRSHARLTYTRVAEALAGDADPQLRPLLDDLKAAHELSKKLTRRRQLRGSIDFDLPEAKIVLDEQGRVAEIARRPRNDAHRLVEEFMLAANEAVARFFQVRGLPTVYRIHDQPDREKLDAFAALARSHGFDLPAGEELTPRVLNDFLKAVEGKPAQKALNSLLLRAMMQAQYSPDNIGHYGLAAPTYLHFTSPIRRYPDLMVHRLLKEHWARGGRPLRDPEREEQEAYLAGVSAQCSDRERAAMKAERDVDSFYSALYMQDKVGEKFKAVVSGVADFGLFCELEEVFVEGLVPAESLGAGVELDKEMQRLIVGSSGRSYSIGDEIVVEVIAVDPARRRITLGLAEKGVAPAGQWLTPEDIVPSSTSRSKPRRQAPRAVAPSPRRPPRGSPPGRPPRRKGTRDGGR